MVLMFAAGAARIVEVLLDRLGRFFLKEQILPVRETLGRRRVTGKKDGGVLVRLGGRLSWSGDR
jgi:hypothetical protein